LAKGGACKRCGAAGVTTEEALLHPENGIHPDSYMSQLSDLLSIKSAAVPA